MKKRIGACLALALLAGIAAGAQDGDANDFRIRPIDGGRAAEITEYAGRSQAVTIPAQLHGLPVTAIGARAFQGKGIISLTIPPGVTAIGDEAFAGNFLLTLTVPTGVRTIGQRAFADCASLTSVTFQGAETAIANANAFPGDLRAKYMAGKGGTYTRQPGANTWTAPPPVPAGMVRINGGTFTMGSPANEPGRWANETQRRVTVSAFYMGRHEVTQKEWFEVMGTTVRQQRDLADPPRPLYSEGDNYPMYYVSWFEAVEYCNRRSQREGLTPAYIISGSGNNRTVTWNRSANGYRLPTEAEWEYACRAGTTTAYNTGATISDNTGWYWGNSSDGTKPVGQKPANAWGLHDMHGNVWEWCWDWYGEYPSGAQTNPTGPASGAFRVFRGGSWGNGEQLLRSAIRDYDDPAFRNSLIGFRLVRP